MPNITLDLGSGRGVVADKFFKNTSYNDDSKPASDTRVPLPMFGETHLEVPPFFIVASKKKGKGRNGIKWRLANPLTEIRNLASRKGKNSIKLTRNEDAETPALVESEQAELAKVRPVLSDFSARDQAKIIKHFRSIYDDEAEDKAVPTKNKPRGFPAVLYKNAKKAGYKETKEKVFRKNELKPKKLPEYKIPAGRPAKGRRQFFVEDDEDGTTEDIEVIKRPDPTARQMRVAQEQKEAREKRKTAPPITDEEMEKQLGLKYFYKTIVKNYKEGVYSGNEVRSMRDKLRELKKSVRKEDYKKIDDFNALVQGTNYPADKLPEPYKTELETYRKNNAKREEIKKKLADYETKIKDKTADRKTRNALFKEVKSYLVEVDKIFEDNAELKDMTKNWVKTFTTDIFNEELRKFKAEPSGKGLTEVITEEGDKDGQDGGCDGEGSGGGILGDIGKKISKTAKKVYKKITNPKQTLQEVKKFGKNLIYGRLDAYPPSVQKIIDANKDAIVQSITLHRKPLSSTYTTLMSWATGGETDKRLKEQPKDTLYHISMWVKLSNGKTLKVEKNEVIAINPNPKPHKDEQTQEVPPPPAGLTFGDMLEKARKEAGDTKFFGYSAKDNNCGNFIEYILRANGMESEQTKDYIGQDTKTILAGFPTLRKVMNTITDIAGRANVLLEGGDLGKAEEKLSHDSNIDMPSQGGRMLGATHSSVFPAHAGHPALASDMFPRIPQAFSQVYLSHPRPIGGEGLYAGGGGGLYAQGSSGRGSYPARKIAPVNRGTPMEGDGFFDDIADAFKFTFSKKGGRAIKEGLRPVGTFLTRTALPNLVSGLTGFGTTLLTGNPVAGFAVGQTAGKALGKLAGNALGDATGTGMKKPRMVKGSAEAKAYMASIRKKKGMKGGELPPRSRSVITDPSLLGQGLY